MYKTHLRDLVEFNKRQFEFTHNNEYIIEATIVYAIYNALGGKKLIPLPPFTDTLYKVIFSIAVVRMKMGRNITANNISKAEVYIISNLNNIKAMEFINNSAANLKIYTNRGVYILEINGDISLALSKIAAICVNETCDVKTQSVLLQNTVYKHLINMGVV